MIWFIYKNDGGFPVVKHPHHPDNYALFHQSALYETDSWWRERLTDGISYHKRSINGLDFVRTIHT